MNTNTTKIEDLILDDNGKDDRLRILKNGMTKYGCMTKPYPHISYSSCTASTINLEAFTYIQGYYNNVNLNDSNNYIEEFQNIRDDLRKILGLKDDVDICLSASGTDLEMLPYLCIPYGSKVNNIIIGPNEVGSGTLLAADGCIFSEVDKTKYSLKKGKKLNGFEKFDIQLFTLPIRDENGNPANEEILLQKISDILKIEKTQKTYTIIHSVYHSKTGLIKPLPENLIQLAKKDPNTILIIDACQFRISRETINDLLDKGCIVFITGSKFFAAPTFSAAALIPNNLRDKAAFNKNIPDGLNFLYGRELFPKRWKSVNHFKLDNNLGLLLRWRAAIFEMQLFNSLSKDRILSTITIFNNCIEKLEKKHTDFIIYSQIDKNEKDYDLLMSQTICTFGFKDKDIDIEKAKEIYQQLISKEWLDQEFPYSVHLGQPVKIKQYNGKWLGTLRIALSAKFFVNYSGKVKSVQEDFIYKEIEYIFKAIEKIIKKF